MAYPRGLPGQWAALVLAAIACPIAATAETGANFRTELRLTPVGAGGGIDPIAIAMRRDWAQIAEVGQAPRATFLDRLVRGTASANAPMFQRGAGVAADRVSKPGKQWPLVLDGARHPVSLLEIKSVEPRPAGAPIVIAALAPADPANRDDGARFPWAATPKLPKLVSKPASGQVPGARETVSAASVSKAPVVLLSSPDPLADIAPQRLFLPFAGDGVRTSRPAEPRVSFRAEPSWLARLPHSVPSARDPFAALEVPKALVAAGPTFIMPFENGRVSSLFNEGRRHPAIDLAGRMGSPVMATSSGQTVTFAGWRGGYGNAVITRDGQGREHLYGHLSAVQVRPGKVLAQGERLGLLGSTGFSTGPHVHYEVKDRRGVHINPVTLLFPRGVRNGYAWAGTGLPSAGKAIVASASPAASANSR